MENSVKCDIDSLLCFQIDKSFYQKAKNENYNFTPISTYNNNNIYSGNDNLLSTPKVYTNDKMYMPYKSLDSLPNETLKSYKITKVKTDSIYRLKQ